MKHILIIISLLVLSACGGSGGNGSTTNNESQGNNDLKDNSNIFTLQNIRFDSKDYYDGEQVTVTEGKSFEVQWVSPILAAYRIDLYLSTNGAVHSEKNQVVSLKCGSASLSLCPNVTGEVQCEINDNKISCSIGNDPIGSKYFLRTDPTLKFIVRGCDAYSNCNAKTFELLLQSTEGV